MRLTENALKEIIKEELKKLLEYEEILVRRGKKVFIRNDEGAENFIRWASEDDEHNLEDLGPRDPQDEYQYDDDEGGGEDYGRGSYDPIGGGYYNPNTGRYTRGGGYGGYGGYGRRRGRYYQ
jgi:hypothetical protein